MAAISKEDFKKMTTILNQLLDNADSFDFRQPVDYETLGLRDYPEVIKKPMDLGTVRDKLGSSRYDQLEDFIEDIQLVWDNCKKYNDSTSWIYKQCDKLEKLYRKLVKNYLPNLVLPAIQTSKDKRKNTTQENSEIQPASMNSAEKILFSQRLQTLDQQQFGMIVQMIQNTCKSAYSESDDKYQLIIDNLDINTFFKYIDMISMQQGEQPKKQQRK